MLPGLDVTPPEPKRCVARAKPQPVEKPFPHGGENGPAAQSPRMGDHTQTPLCIAEAPKSDTTPALAPGRKELALVLLISRPGSTEPDLVAAWIRTIGPWRCADCSPELSWMYKTDAKAAWDRLAEEGYVWKKIECEIRPLDVAKSYRKTGRSQKSKL